MVRIVAGNGCSNDAPSMVDELLSVVALVGAGEVGHRMARQSQAK